MLVGSVGLGANAVWGSAMGSCTANKLVFGRAALEDDALVVCRRQTETHTTTHTIPGRKVQVEDTGIVRGYLRTPASAEQLGGGPPEPIEVIAIDLRCF